LKAIPLSQQQINTFVNKASYENIGMFFLVKNGIIDDGGVFDEDTNSIIKFSKMTLEEKEEIFGGFIDGFDIQYVTDQCIIFRKLNLVWFKNGFFELLEAIESGSVFKYRDQRGNEYEAEFVPTNVGNKKKTQIKRIYRSPKTDVGMDALDS
jgi:hypothetical protein